MKPTQIIDMREDLLARCERDPRFMRYLNQCFRDNAADDSANDVMAGAVYRMAKMGDLYRVSPEMSGLVLSAALALDESDTFDITLAPSPWGLVRFDSPLPVRDIRGRTMLLHWLQWGPMGITDDPRSAVALVGWNDDREPDEVQTKDLTELTVAERNHMSQVTGRWNFVGCEVKIAGDPLGAQVVPLSEEAARRIESLGLDERGEITRRSFENVSRYLHALWLLLGQQIVTTTQEPQGLSKRMRQGKVKPQRVRVVRLRSKVTGAKPGESQVEWTCRWMVKGHWRWQVCGPNHPLAQERDGGYRARIWVNPFVKGPEDAPWKTGEIVYDLVR